MAEQTAAAQAREMQGAKASKPAGKDEVKKDEDGNIIGSNITTDGKLMPAVKEQEPPGLVASNLVGGVGIYGSGQDQDGEAVEAEGEKVMEERKADAEEAEKKAEEQSAKAQEANEAAQEEAKKPHSEQKKAKGK